MEFRRSNRSSDQIDRIREHNKSVLRTRSGRLALIRTLQLDDAELVARLFPAYPPASLVRCRRLRPRSGRPRSCRCKCGRMHLGHPRRVFRLRSASASTARRGCVSRSFENSMSKISFRELAIGIDAASSRTWNWGLYVVEYFLDIALELLRATQRLVDLTIACVANDWWCCGTSPTSK